MTTANSHHSAELFERAVKVLPGGNSRTTIFTAPYPVYAQKGEGFRIQDVDGVERIDFLSNYTSLIHGHRHPEIMEAVLKQLELGTCFANPTVSEVQLAELLCERVPSFEQVRFCNSGTEAVMTAVKAAQAHTGRSMIAKCEGCYHGTYGPVEVSLDSGPENWGAQSSPASVPYGHGTSEGVLRDVVVIPFNDVDSVERLLGPYAEKLAAVVVDPMPNRTGLIPGSQEFLNTLRAFTRKHGILLIFDEVITFRVEQGGLQSRLGVEPDLTTLAKIIGGGFPVGAIAGARNVMEVFDQRQGRPGLPHSGTFNANPVTMVAGLSAMSMMTSAAFERLNQLGERARQGLAAAFRQAEMPGQVTGAGSLFCLHFNDKPLSDYRSAYKTPVETARMGRLHGYLLDNGIIMGSGGLGCVSTVMGEAEVDQIADTVLAGLKQIREEEHKAS